MVVNAIGHLAEAAWHHPDLTVTYNAVEVRLMSHDAKGITERDSRWPGRSRSWCNGSPAGRVARSPARRKTRATPISSMTKAWPAPSGTGGG